MNFIQQLHIWSKGDIQQGKWMIGIAVMILLPLAFFLFRSNFSFQKGMTLPVCLLVIVNIAYGSYLLHSKPKFLIQTERKFYSNPEQTLDSERQKAKSDNKNYHTLKCVWGICIIVFVVLYFVLLKDYYKGLSVGFAVFFLAFLIIDSLFNQRLSSYLESLNV